LAAILPFALGLMYCGFTATLTRYSILDGANSIPRDIDETTDAAEAEVKRLIIAVNQTPLRNFARQLISFRLIYFPD
jgi:hypothetical protein